VRRRRRSIIFLVVALSAVVYLMYTAFAGGSTYYLTMAEFWEAESREGALRVSGQVYPGSIEWDKEQKVLRFAIYSEETEPLWVEYKGVRPDMLFDDVEVIVEGRLSGTVFEARTVLVKCPSKFEVDGGF